MDLSPNRPSVSPLSRSKMQSDSSLKIQDLKYKEKLLQMDKINSKLQAQLDETLIELEKANKNLQLQNQMKETQDNDYLRLIKDNELLRGDLQFKHQEIELIKQKLTQKTNQYQQQIDLLKEQYEQFQQSLINKHIIEMNSKLENQKQQFDTYSHLQAERLKECEFQEKQAQDNLQDAKQQIQELIILNNESKSQNEIYGKQLNQERQQFAEKELTEQLYIKKNEQLQIENSRLTTELDIQREKYIKLQSQYEENINNLVISKEQQAEEQASKLYQQHEQSIANLTSQNQDIWKQLQETKSINQIQQKEIQRITQLNQIQEQELKDKEQKLKNIISQYNQTNENNVTLQQKLSQTEQALTLYKQQLDDFKTTRNEFEQRMIERSKQILRQKESEFIYSQQQSEQKIQELTQELEKIENENQTQQFKQLQEKLGNESTIKSLQVRIQGIEEQNKTLNQLLDDVRSELIIKSSQCEELSLSLNKEKTYNQTTLRIQKNQLTDLQQKLKEYQVEIDRLSSDVRERDDILENQRAQFMNEKNELEQQIRIIFEKMAQQKQKILEIEENNYQQSIMIQQLSTNKDKLEKELRQLQNISSDQIKSQLEQISQLNQQVNAQLQMIQSHEEQINTNETQISELQAQLEEQYAQNQQLSKEAVELNDELEETRQDREAKIQEMDQWKRQFKQNNVPLVDFEQIKREADQYKNKSMDQEQLINKLETTQQANNKEIYHLQDELTSLKQNYQDIQQQHQAKKKENDSVSTEFENLKREYQRQQNQFKELEQRDQQNSELVLKQKRELQRLNDDMETKNRQLQNMETQLNKKFDELTSKQRELEELRKRNQQDALGRMTTSPSQKSVMMGSQNLARSTAKGLTTKIQSEQQQQQ